MNGALEAKIWRVKMRVEKLLCDFGIENQLWVSYDSARDKIKLNSKVRFRI